MVEVGGCLKGDGGGWWRMLDVCVEVNGGGGWV